MTQPKYTRLSAPRVIKWKRAETIELGLLEWLGKQVMHRRGLHLTCWGTNGTRFGQKVEDSDSTKSTKSNSHLMQTVQSCSSHGGVVGFGATHKSHFIWTHPMSMCVCVCACACACAAQTQVWSSGLGARKPETLELKIACFWCRPFLTRNGLFAFDLSLFNVDRTRTLTSKRYTGLTNTGWSANPLCFFSRHA